MTTQDSMRSSQLAFHQLLKYVVVFTAQSTDFKPAFAAWLYDVLVDMFYFLCLYVELKPATCAGWQLLALARARQKQPH